MLRAFYSKKEHRGYIPLREAISGAKWLHIFEEQSARLFLFNSVRNEFETSVRETEVSKCSKLNVITTTLANLVLFSSTVCRP